MTTETIDNAETSTEDTAGLKNKNRELHGIIKKLETQVAKLTDDVSDAFENARAESGTELDKANRQIAKLTKERDDAVSRADKSDKGLREYKASSALATAIASANVDADDVEMVTMALTSMIVDGEDGEPSIKGKSIEDYTKNYFATTGKKYTRAADHSGGGATGSEGAKSQAWTKLPETAADWAKFNALATPERNAVADQLGAPELKI